MPSDAVSVTLFPWQNVVGPSAAITGTSGAGCEVTTKGSEIEEQPFGCVPTDLVGTVDDYPDTLGRWVG